ncbi:FAD-binding protein [Terrilactibacillus sp. BCM23-1]|uniref:FAD-binding protein n=1 Tax=Terrilactibacillus tamarindi TaxID=2599694 RepID=A0A6N8CTY9_9BACI|nr:NAD(P)/FAD-dependent oxidoreductase [Terrilactibacillus tamarindi]MTT32475.1 FAD-binding protein [Terrilactibacillus tamarindi]
MYDIIIVGGGPAGQSAALFTSKAGQKTLLLDNEKGLTQRALLKNHYGAKELSGKELVSIGKEQAQSFGTKIQKAQVISIENNKGAFLLQTEDGETFEGKQVILATGSNSKLAENSGLKTMPGKEPYVKTIIEVDQDGHTNIPGIWACGVAAGVSVHTIITSGDGARVAVNLLSEIKGERFVDHDKL